MTSMALDVTWHAAHPYVLAPVDHHLHAFVRLEVVRKAWNLYTANIHASWMQLTLWPAYTDTSRS